MALAGPLRNVLIIDNGKPCNSETPKVISKLTKEDVEKYKIVTFYKGLAQSGVKRENGFEITTNTNDKFTATKLIFATGIKDVMPDIKGFKECWGISVVH